MDLYNFISIANYVIGKGAPGQTKNLTTVLCA